MVITERKAIDQVHREGRQKRGGGKVIGMSVSDAVADRAGDLAGFAGAMPTPEFAALVVDECRSLLGRLRDDSLRTVARLRMEGYTVEEVADQLGCSAAHGGPEDQADPRDLAGRGRGRIISAKPEPESTELPPPLSVLDEIDQICDRFEGA